MVFKNMKINSHSKIIHPLRNQSIIKGSQQIQKEEKEGGRDREKKRGRKRRRKRRRSRSRKGERCGKMGQNEI